MVTTQSDDTGFDAGAEQTSDTHTDTSKFPGLDSYLSDGGNPYVQRVLQELEHDKQLLRERIGKHKDSSFNDDFWLKQGIKIPDEIEDEEGYFHRVRLGLARFATKLVDHFESALNGENPHVLYRALAVNIKTKNNPANRNSNGYFWFSSHAPSPFVTKEILDGHLEYTTVLAKFDERIKNANPVEGSSIRAKKRAFMKSVPAEYSSLQINNSREMQDLFVKELLAKILPDLECTKGGIEGIITEAEKGLSQAEDLQEKLRNAMELVQNLTTPFFDDMVSNTLSVIAYRIMKIALQHYTEQ